jgi:glutathione synthase/RimK-type ligase-like ATP-grasp enzyme
VQKIGGRIRAFKRLGVSGDWKTNTGSAMLEEFEPSAAQRAWAEHAASLFGQDLDILTVDTIVEEATGKEWILEVNGTSSGLSPDTEAEDNIDIRDLVVSRMSAALCATSPTAPAVAQMAEEAADRSP